MFDREQIGSVSLAAGLFVFLLTACATIAAEPPLPLPGQVTDQNWTVEQRRKWYLGSQGSRLIPERWLRALEGPGTDQKLLTADNMSKYNYIDGSYAGSSLPLGFAIDRQDDKRLYRTKLQWFERQTSHEPWVGMNCAACHTAQLEYNDHTIILDGAPALSDFQTLTADINQAMNDTFAQPAKWDRFATAVLAPTGQSDTSRDTSANRLMLRGAVAKWLEYENVLKGMNATGIDYGYGRLDAVGHILNKTAMFNQASGQIRGEPDAPVSFPFIWNAPQHDFVQWNGIVPNKKFGPEARAFDVGALVRNTSEVMGVFADVAVTNRPSWDGYRSSVDIDNLVAMETQLEKLMSPAWPEIFPKIDPDKRVHGERLFKRDCAGCHAPLARTDLRSPVKAEMTPLFGAIAVGTDPWMACNAYTYQAEGGLLTEIPIRVVPVLSKDKGQVQYLKGRENTVAYLQTQAVGVLLAKKWRIVGNGLNVWTGFPPVIAVPADPSGLADNQQMSKADRLKKCQTDARNHADVTAQRLLAYKARPLNGIWATGPYLHNGSVRSLYQLLLHPDKRATSFTVGGREFDPVEVGYLDKAGFVGRQFKTRDENGSPIPGNSNRGHFYREYDDPQDRWALVEYMKSL